MLDHHIMQCGFLSVSFSGQTSYFQNNVVYFCFSFDFTLVAMRWVSLAQAVPAMFCLAVAASLVAAVSAMIERSVMRAHGQCWEQNGAKVFPIVADQPHLGSWIDVRLQPWGLGCRVCSETNVSSAWASHSAQSPLQKANLLRHPP